ncbi:uncharacterized protein LOC124899332 isoform X2 [Capsicum annuum]|uniref:uncharacterized protein LOC124899332 isoform X2 n=1 Tax=Capsicum annuum TaxID=4072 RepID=UPI001FB10201|nr:uncharacterized protein LOC124899332 isoform X2 [Capsicum annuum]
MEKIEGIILNWNGLQNSKQGEQNDVQVHFAEGDEVIAAVVVETKLVSNKLSGRWIQELQDISAPTKSYNMTLRNPPMESVSTWVTPLLLEFWVLFYGSLQSRLV